MAVGTCQSGKSGSRPVPCTWASRYRSLKEEEIWLNEYRSLEEARESIGRWIEEYNHDRPHRALKNRTPREARADFAQPQPLTNTQALSV